MRRELLPFWIKVFIWIFIIGAVVIVGVVIAAIWSNYIPVSLYGLRTEYIDTDIGLFLAFIFLLKGVVSIALWRNWSKAIDLALFDAILGIVITIYVSLSSIGSSQINLRLEIFVLIYYLYCLIKVRHKWVTYYKENLSL